MENETIYFRCGDCGRELGDFYYTDCFGTKFCKECTSSSGIPRAKHIRNQPPPPSPQFPDGKNKIGVDFKQFINSKKEIELEDKFFRQIMDNRNKILEEFAKAYLAETGLNPSEVVMCHKTLFEDGIFKFVTYFEPKEK